MELNNQDRLFKVLTAVASPCFDCWRPRVWCRNKGGRRRWEVWQLRPPPGPGLLRSWAQTPLWRAGWGQRNSGRHISSNWNLNFISLCCNKNGCFILTCRNSKKTFKELSWRVGDDGEGWDEVEEQHDLHRDLNGAGWHGEHYVVLDPVPQGEVTAGYGEVEEEQN